MNLSLFHKAILCYYMFDKQEKLVPDVVDNIIKCKSFNEVSTFVLTNVVEGLKEDQNEFNNEKFIPDLLNYLENYLQSLGKKEILKRHLSPNEIKLFSRILKPTITIIEQELQKRKIKNGTSYFTSDDMDELLDKLGKCKTEDDIQKLYKHYTAHGSSIYNSILRGLYTFRDLNEIRPKILSESEKYGIDFDTYIKKLSEILKLRESMRLECKLESDIQLYRGQSVKGTRIMANLIDKKYEDKYELMSYLNGDNGKNKPILSDKGFLSTSTSLTVAKNFAKKQVLLTINAKKGTTYLKNLSEETHYKKEREWLLIPNQKLQVVEATIENNLLNIIVNTVR